MFWHFKGRSLSVRHHNLDNLVSLHYWTTSLLQPLKRAWKLNVRVCTPLRSIEGDGGGAALILTLNPKRPRCLFGGRLGLMLFFKGEKICCLCRNRTTVPPFTSRGLVALLWRKEIWTEIFSCLFDDEVSNWYYMSLNGGRGVELKTWTWGEIFALLWCYRA